MYVILLHPIVLGRYIISIVVLYLPSIVFSTAVWKVKLSVLKHFGKCLLIVIRVGWISETQSL